MTERLYAAVAVAMASACLDHTMTPVDTEPPIARVQIVWQDSALLVGHSLSLSVRAWDSTNQEITKPHVLWSSAYPTWLPIDRFGTATADSTNPGGNFPVYATSLGTGVRDTLVLHVAHPGELKWRITLGPMPILGGPAQGPDGTIYVLGDVAGVSATTLYAVTPKGNIKWQRRLDQVDYGNYPVIGVDGTIYVVGQYVYAYAPDGMLRWAITNRPTTDPPDGCSSAISSTGALFAAMAYDLFAFNGASGDTLWQGPRANDAGWLLPPSVSADGRTVFVKNTGSPLYAFGATDGSLKWSFPDPNGLITFGIGPITYGSRLIVPIGDALMEADTMGQTYGTGPDIGYGISEPAVAPDGTLYIQVPQLYGVQAYDPAHVQLWKAYGFKARWPEFGGPALAAGGMLYVAAQDGFYALQLGMSGVSVRWRYPANPADSLLFAGAPLIGPDGTIYTFSSCDSGRESLPCSEELIALWEDKPIEPNSPWPMWRHDARRSGQADR